ncbi:hypothetical protein GCM10011369_02810 [Neiella marina]|uniref:Uncharacterized protein n=1 Tax=Neiella marina TaxID=508461 RepID=A0A8J2U1Z2_9GAMM|nr:hypothetical protein [Neiella marina]GGA64863.1 hypothetical protein GCM10011369_02810 [Neiella marina]
MSNFQIDWHNRYSVVSFSGELSATDINEANIALHQDKRIATHIGSLWDFSGSTITPNGPIAINFAVGLDVASSFIIPTKFVALVACCEPIERLCQRYIDTCQQAGSSWQCQIFSTRSKAQHWLDAAALDQASI